MSRLDDLLAEHLADPFPTTVEKGHDYREIEPVTIDAAIVGWAERATNTRGLTVDDRTRLREAADDLRASLEALPHEARPYFERLLSLAAAALSAA